MCAAHKFGGNVSLSHRAGLALRGSALGYCNSGNKTTSVSFTGFAPSSSMCSLPTWTRPAPGAVPRTFRPVYGSPRKSRPNTAKRQQSALYQLCNALTQPRLVHTGGVLRCIPDTETYGVLTCTGMQGSLTFPQARRP